MNQEHEILGSRAHVMNDFMALGGRKDSEHGANCFDILRRHGSQAIDNNKVHHGGYQLIAGYQSIAFLYLHNCRV